MTDIIYSDSDCRGGRFIASTTTSDHLFIVQDKSTRITPRRVYASAIVIYRFEIDLAELIDLEREEEMLYLLNTAILSLQE